MQNTIYNTTHSNARYNALTLNLKMHFVQYSVHVQEFPEDSVIGRVCATVHDDLLEEEVPYLESIITCISTLLLAVNTIVIHRPDFPDIDEEWILHSLKCSTRNSAYCAQVLQNVQNKLQLKTV